MSEYIAMLEYAGIIDEGATDEEYQEYLSRVDNDYRVSYKSWQKTLEELEQLNRMYEKELEPYFSQEHLDSIPDEIWHLHSQYVDGIMILETELGY